MREAKENFTRSGGIRVRLKKCKSCGKYTLQENCPSCGGKAVSPHPAKFSPEDPYGEYRRRLKREALDLGGSND